MGESKHTPQWTPEELARLTNEAGERIRKERAAAQAEADARWKEAESKRLRLEQAAPLMLEALRAEESCECTAPESRFSAYPCAACRERRRAAIRAATGGEP